MLNINEKSTSFIQECTVHDISVFSMFVFPCRKSGSLKATVCVSHSSGWDTSAQWLFSLEMHGFCISNPSIQTQTKPI